MVGEEALKRVKRLLEELGVPFEAEESIRFQLGDVLVEIGFESGQPTVDVSVQLPSSSDEDVDSYADNIRNALRFSARLRGGELSYELDTSLPDYPMLHILRRYSDLEKLLSDLREAVEEFRELISGGAPVES